MEGAEGVDLEEKLLKAYDVIIGTTVSSGEILADKYATRYLNDKTSHIERVNEAKDLYERLAKSGIVKIRKNVKGGGISGVIRTVISYDLVVRNKDRAKKLISEYVARHPNSG